MKKFIVLVFSIFILWGCNDSSTSGTDVCKDITCDSHGTCVNLNDTAACVCNEGFSNKIVSGIPTCVENTTTDCGGVTCEGWQECVEDACVTKEGSCKDDTECTTEKTYCDTGSHTCKDNAINPCADITCSGHGDCIANGDTPICICEAGYTAQGTECIAQEDPCADIKCTDGVTEDSHGTCVASGQTPVCICSTGYKADGSTKCVEDSTDLCADVVCSNDWQECKEGDCVAKDGKCDTNGDCVGNTTCDTATHLCVAPTNPCEGITCTDGETEVSHGTCLVNNDAALCFCSDGYHVSDDHIKCIANDPCQFVTCDGWETCNAGVCEVNDGKCNTNGDCVGNNFYCDSADHTCKENTGGNDVCTDINCTDGETEESHGICFDANGTATCSCNAGYYRPNDDSTKCLPINDLCEGITCSNHGTCRVVNEQPVCACEAGYIVDGLNCNEDKCYGVTCDNHGTCSVINGVSQCSCEDGYVSDALHCYGTCFGNRDCDDGLYCNGVEQCVDYPDDNTSAKYCKSGDFIDCHQNDEEYACLARAYCDEATDSCKYELPDTDDDGFTSSSCSTPDGTTGTDCNDNDEDINFSTSETCNFLDDNCDQIVDNGLTYSDGTDARLSYGDSNSGCTRSDTYGTNTCGIINYSAIWSKNEFIAIWVDQRDGSDQIYMARYNEAGDQTSGTEYQITAIGNVASKTIGKYAIAADITDEKYMIVWREGNDKVKRVFINRYGAKLSQPVTVASSNQAMVGDPAVIWVDTKFAVMTVNRNGNYYDYIRLALVSNTNSETTNIALYAPSHIGTYYHIDHPQMFFDGSNINAVFNLRYSTNGARYLRLYRFNKDTADLETGFPKDLSTGMPTVANSTFSVHWQKEDGENVYFTTTRNTDNTIKVFKYNKRFEQINSTNVITGVANQYFQPSLIWTGNQYVLSFAGRTDVSNQTTSNIYLARVDMLGNVSQQATKTSQTDDNNYFPTLVDRDKKFTLFWLNNSSENWELYMDKITCGN